MVMDYYRLNKQTVKNNYLLPLITDLIDSMVIRVYSLKWTYDEDITM